MLTIAMYVAAAFVGCVLLFLVGLTCYGIFAACIAQPHLTPHDYGRPNQSKMPDPLRRIISMDDVSEEMKRELTTI